MDPTSEAPSAPLASMDDRRSAFAPARRVTLYDDRLEAAAQGAVRFRGRLGDVVEVRLNVEPAGRDAQVVCRLGFSDGRAFAFGSRSAQSPGRWSNNAVEFQAFTPALLSRLAAIAPDAVYEEGPRLSTRLALAAAGVALALGGLAFAGYMALERESALLALIGLPFTAMGVMIAVLFRPARPAPFDPADMARRLSGESLSASSQ